MSSRSQVASMRRETIGSFFGNSPTARLLRSDYAPWLVEFFNRTFKLGDAIALPQSELRLRLSLFLDELHETDPDVLSGTPDRYLSSWTEAGWLNRFLDSNSLEPQFQLTRYSEEAIRFVDQAVSRNTDLVGTESRLRMVIEAIEDIVRGASADPNKRLEYLRQQRAQIDAEIMAIEGGQSVAIYRPSQIRERFQNAIELLKQLQSDFRAVEERFQAIARDVQSRHSQNLDTRGGILGFALDAEDELKHQDEGISFSAFVAFLFSPTERASLLKNIAEIQKLAALSDQTESLARLRRMLPSLLAEADKVMRTTARLTGALRRLLDTRSSEERVRLAQVLRDVRKSMMELGPSASAEISLEIEADLEIASPMSRSFWSPPPTLEIEAATEFTFDLERAQQVAAAFSKLQRLDWKRLRATIGEVTQGGYRPTLSQLVQLRPIRGGVLELLGYLQIAHDDGHIIDNVQSESIEFTEEHGTQRHVRAVVPHITFLPRSARQHIPVKPR